MSSDPNDRPETPEAQAEDPQNAAPENAATQEPTGEQSVPSAEQQQPESPRRRILIGSQRDPAAYRPKPKRDWLPTAQQAKEKRRAEQAAQAKPPEPGPAAPPPAAPASEAVSPPVAAQTPAAPAVAPQPPVAPPAEVVAQEAPTATPVPPQVPVAEPTPPVPAPAPVVQVAPAVQAAPVAPPTPVAPASTPRVETPTPAAEQAPTREGESGREDRGRRDRRGRRREERPEKKLDLGPAFTRTVEPPNIRQRLSDDLEAELEQAMEGVSLDDAIAGAAPVAGAAILEPETRQTAKVIAVQRDDVFVELGGPEQGIVPLRAFAEPPQPEQEIEVVVVRFNAEEGLYELTLPHVAAAVGDWSSIFEGMVVEARVTGHNTGGLECEVNHIRGFIPISQIALYRVENLEEFVEQKFACLVLEANPDRQNLVLSRRAVLEREKEEARERLMESLAPGQVHDGVVRKLMDFGAFVDLGGVDGLFHISQLSWGRVRHPSDVLAEGQRVRVRIDKIDRDTGRISLAYRDLMESPWATADQKYLPNTRVHGRVAKLMEFGAFVELEPGVQGLVHISELSHKRVARVADVLKEGDEIDVMVLAVDREAQRISLSLKNLTEPPEPEAKPATAAPKPEEPPPPPPKPKKPTGPLKGGLGRSAGGDRFGLNW